MSDKVQNLKFKSSLDNIHLVEKFVDAICDEYNINNSYFGNIVIALTEAATNAIVHGNKQDSDKTVTITFDPKPAGLSFIIKDNGDGFNFNNIPDPTDVENKTKSEEGRGIFLIKSLADEVIFNDTGNSVELIFNISSINKELALDRISKLKSYSKTKKTGDTKSKTE